MLQGYVRPTTEVKSLTGDTTSSSTTPNKIATTIEDIEEFRDIEFPVIREEEIDDYDDDDDSSGEMEFEDYL